MVRTDLAKAFKKSFDVTISPKNLGFKKRKLVGTLKKLKCGGSDSPHDTVGGNSVDIISRFYRHMERLGFKVTVEIERK